MFKILYCEDEYKSVITKKCGRSAKNYCTD